MNLYDVALFAHVVGVVGIFAVMGTWLFGLAALRRAQRVEQVRALAWLIVVTAPAMLASLLVLGLAGFYMVLTVWTLQTSWIVVSLVSMLLIGPIGAFVLDARLHVILDGARQAPDGPLPDALAARTHDPLLMTGAQMMVAVLVGVVFLMTTKPPLILAVLVIGAALALGLLPGLLAQWSVRRARPVGVRATDDPFKRKSIWTRRW